MVEMRQELRSLILLNNSMEYIISREVDRYLASQENGIRQFISLLINPPLDHIFIQLKTVLTLSPCFLDRFY